MTQPYTGPTKLRPAHINPTRDREIRAAALEEAVRVVERMVAEGASAADLVRAIRALVGEGGG